MFIFNVSGINVINVVVCEFINLEINNNIIV